MGFGVWGLGFGVLQSLGSKKGLGVRVSGFGFRVESRWDIELASKPDKQREPELRRPGTRAARSLADRVRLSCFW